MDFQPTEGQSRALQMVDDIVGKPVQAVIRGYAGSGKTTCLQDVLAKYRDVVLLSPTGKAASRITEITGVRAGTIHRWLYDCIRDKQTRETVFVRKPLNKIRVPASKLVVVDEASMVAAPEYQMLTEVQVALGLTLLFIGDSFQLPPVQPRDAEPFGVLEPGFIATCVDLQEITRQALDSPIIRATMAIREGDPCEALADMDLVMPEDLDDRLAAGRDGMIICWRNETRHAMNAAVRRARGIENGLTAGEPLLVLRNNYGLDVYNGEIHAFGGWVDNLGDREVSVFLDGRRQVVKLNFATGLLGGHEVVLCKEIVDGKYDKISPTSLEKAVNYWQKHRELSYIHCNQGYVLTAHKSQGSEADSVLVCLESGILQRLSTLEGRRWLYSACTRAKKELSITYV